MSKLCFGKVLFYFIFYFFFFFFFFFWGGGGVSLMTAVIHAFILGKKLVGIYGYV